MENVNDNNKEGTRCSECGKPLLPGKFQHKYEDSNKWYCAECWEKVKARRKAKE